ncbi:hypothetical protein KA078_03315 [Candidatus Woesebacteria bacterium]|nr:hypothetical protein [Candidatus Woesebacteria bacterium]
MHLFCLQIIDVSGDTYHVSEYIPYELRNYNWQVAFWAYNFCVLEMPSVKAKYWAETHGSQLEGTFSVKGRTAMSINILDFEVVLRDNDRDLPIIVETAVEGEYHIFAPTAINLNVFVEMLPFWALVATMDDENLHHPCTDNTRPLMIDGQFPGQFSNFFTAPESGKGRVSLRSQRDYDLGMKFHMQGAAHRLVMDFFKAVNSVSEESKTWMGTTLKTDIQQWMEQRGTTGLPAPSESSGLRLPPYGKREISPVFEDEGYFNPERKLRVVIEFLEIDDFNKLAKEKGISEWDPYAEVA